MDTKLKIVWPVNNHVSFEDKTCDEADVTYAELVALAEANGFSDEDGAAVSDWLAQATEVSFLVIQSEDTVFDLTHLFRKEPEELLDLFETEDFGAITFACATLGAHWFNETAQIYDAINDIQIGSFSAENIIAEYLPTLNDGLDEAGAWSYFDADEFVKKNMDITVEENWYNGKDYWKHD